jgi:signal transduction histidine kinase
MIFRKFIGWILRWIEIQKAEIKTPRGRNIPYAELERKTKDLEKLIQHMSAENEEIKTAFFRNIYHEIRTPMNSILGFSSLLHNENLTAEKRNMYTDQVWKSSVVFLQFIDDLVEASMLETQKTALDPNWFAVNDMMQELYQLCNRHRHIMDKNSVALLLNKVNFSENIHAETDRKRLLQMLDCIITDCMAGMEKGIIELGYKPILNGGLVFTIKTMTHKRKDAHEEIDVKRVAISGRKYGSNLRKRIADRLILLFGGEISTETEETGISLMRIVISQISIRNNELITNNTKPNDKKIAI